MDGHFKIPKRVVTWRLCKDGRRRLRRGQFKCLMGFTGVDGALLLPPTLIPQERWEDIETILRPYLAELQATRLQAGWQLTDTMPVFHCTDNYRRDWKGVARLYKEIWMALQVSADASTPKSTALRAKIMQWLSDYLIVTGDPEHDVIKLRKLLSRKNKQSHAALSDHADILHRLAAPLAEAPAVDELALRGPILLPLRVRELLAATVASWVTSYEIGFGPNFFHSLETCQDCVSRSII